MGFLYDEMQSQTVKKKHKNKVEVVLESLSGEDAADLKTALDNPEIPSIVIARVLKSRGIDLSDTTIGRYRNNEHR